MTSDLLRQCLEYVFGHEGGFTDRASDPGNWTGGKVNVGQRKGTKYGISAASYPTLDIARLTLADAAEIYERNYWNPIGGDQLARRIGGGMAFVIFDMAINSGVGRALKFYQNWKSIDSYCDARLAWMKTLDIWEEYGRGWTTRVGRVREQAHALQLVYPAQPPVGMPAAVRLITVEPGVVGRISGVKRIYVNGERIDTDDIDAVSVVGDKLYLTITPDKGPGQGD